MLRVHAECPCYISALCRCRIAALHVLAIHVHGACPMLHVLDAYPYCLSNVNVHFACLFRMPVLHVFTCLRNSQLHKRSHCDFFARLARLARIEIICLRKAFLFENKFRNETHCQPTFFLWNNGTCTVDGVL
jgi:hypothetical protein